MRARPAWQPAQDGVMIFMPGGTASVHDTQEQLSQLEDGFKTPINPEPNRTSHSGFTSDWSPETLVGDSEEILFEAASTALSTPEPSMGQDLLSQLIFAAERSSTEPATPGSESLSGDTKLSSTEDSVEVGYTSERTDFQEDSPSPSLRRAKQRRTARQLHHFRAVFRPLTDLAVARRLDFGRNNLRTHKKVTVPLRQELGAIERKPRHSYTPDQRELLCILYRFYYSEDADAIPKIFNVITGLELRHSRIRSYFWDHMCLYGPESFLPFSRVLSVPFSIPQDYYADIISEIEQQANDLRLNVQRRSVEVGFVCGKARKSSSPSVLQNYQSMVEKTKQEARDEAANSVIAREIAATAQLLGLMPRAVKLPFEDHVELFTDVESPKLMTTSVETLNPISNKPHLTFRVWDADNRTKFMNGGFVAQAFVDWPRPFPAPIVLDDPSGAGKILTALHLSKHGDTPVYISTASSLLQALSYAKSMRQPKIALVSLDAQCLQAEHKLHHAANVFPWLKAQGIARWARYKGNGEYFVWGEIAADAVLHTLELEKLINHLNSDAGCGNLLNFDVFESGVKTNTIAAALREKNKTLNTATARALGKIAKAFGMAQSNMTLQHLQDLVARLLDGWTILKPEMMDMHTTSSLAATFATALGRHHANHTLQDIMGAFMDGVDDGTRCIEHWSRSRSGSRRQRFRTA
ncbi:hypothetical protein M3J09_003625 [Ascochyta lentis]